MPRKIRELKSQLRKAGFQSRPAKGSHQRWYHPDHPMIQLTISGHDGDDADRYQEDDVAEALEKLEEHKRRLP
jgi:predicted RNA binding protein YcfA (HicA-like mRNA interferase family)